MNTAEYVASLPHPNLSASIDGIWLEDEVPGFRTSYISGRESYSTQIQEITSKRIAGSRYSGRQLPSRELIIHYYITVDTYEQFQKSFNKLRGILWNKEEVRIIFNDELDIFYVGTASATEPQYLVNHHTAEGDIYIKCCKPFKYSVQEYEVTADSNGLIDIDYTGTYPAYPQLTSKTKSSVGFLAFTNQNAKIIQLGTPDDADATDAGRSVERVNDSFAGGSISDYVTNAAQTVALGVNSILVRGTPGASTDGAYPISYGTETSTWHGPSITKTFTQTSNFTASWRLCFVGDTTGRNLGLVQIHVRGVNGSGNAVSIASVTYVKEKTGNNDAICIIHINGKQKQNINYTYEHTNKFSGVGSNRGGGSIERFGTKLTFNLASGSVIKTFTIPEIKNYKATAIDVTFGKWGPQLGKDTTPIAHNYLEELSFVEHNVDSFERVPNKFKNKDNVVADCENARITINGAFQDKYGALGNDWEDFALEPGPNQIKCIYSGWATTAPTFKIKYRNVYI